MNRGRADAYDLSPRRLVFAVLAERDEEKSELRRMAYAARLGQADDKGWSKAMKELTE
jgi:hypothetical protein